jgi:hypothetical protein
LELFLSFLNWGKKNWNRVLVAIAVIVLLSDVGSEWLSVL